MQFKVKKIDSSLEKRILTGMIVDKGFLQAVHGFADIAYFQNSFAKKCAVWCLEYFDQYEDAPFDTIQDIYQSKLPTLNNDEPEIVAKLLADISERYSLTRTFNDKYMLDQAIRYFKRRELEIASGNVRVLLDEDKIEEAEREITTLRKFSKIPSAWSNPFDEENVDRVFEDKDLGFFRFPGRLGDFLGNFDRGWFVAFIGPFKRGKTWWLQEMAVIAMMRGLRVAFISLEMGARAMHDRIYKRLVGASKTGGPTKYPTFDCISNQSGECDLPERTSDIPLFDAAGRRPSRFDSTSPYVPCTSCRGNGGPYELTSWWEMLDRPSYSHHFISEQMKSMEKQYKHALRTISYPRFSANTEDILRDLDRLEAEEDFIPDVIIIDYADILKNESAITVDAVDETWKRIAQMGGERRAMMVTASQGTRQGTEVATLKQKHMALWIGKLAHVDAMFSLNQTESEKKRGLMRVGVMAHRHEDFEETATCCVLQALNYGQVHLDSEIPPPPRWEEREGEDVG